MPNDAWAEQYEAWLDARSEGLSEDEPDEGECFFCGQPIDPDYRNSCGCKEG